MGILKNKNKYDKSNVILKDKNFVYYNKFKNNDNKYTFIDYGVSYVNKSFFSKYKKKVKIDLSSIFLEMSKKNLLKGYEIKKRFYEIGSYNGIREFKKFIKNEIY